MGRMDTPLHEARIRALLTQDALSRKAGVSQKVISAAEQGQRLSDLSQEKLAQALGVPRASLFPETEEASA